MSNVKMPVLKIGDLQASKPIIQGGMGVGISMSGLASAVANEGGIGVISSIGLGMASPKTDKSFRVRNKNSLREEIQKARKLSDGIIGLNIMVAVSDFDELIKIGYEEEVDIIFLGAGLPLKLPKTLTLPMVKKSKTKIGIIVSSARATRLILTHWTKHFDSLPDVIVVEGPLAGGHLGFKSNQIDDPSYSLERIIPKVIDEVRSFEKLYKKDIPVIAAGGIYSGADIHKFLQLGVQGVQMATRFVATSECDASDEFKNSYIKCKKDDLVIIESPLGLPGRAIRNKYLDEVSNDIRKPVVCPWKCLKTCDYKKVPYCIAEALTNAKKGLLSEGFSFAGVNAYKVNKIYSVEELFRIIESEFNESVESLQKYIKNDRISRLAGHDQAKTAPL